MLGDVAEGVFPEDAPEAVVGGAWGGPFRSEVASPALIGEADIAAFVAIFSVRPSVIFS